MPGCTTRSRGKGRCCCCSTAARARATTTGSISAPRWRAATASSCPTCAGHGRSSDPEWLLGPDQVGDDVLALIEHLGEAPAATVAFSVGATSMLKLLVRRPDATGAFVAIAPSLHARARSGGGHHVAARGRRASSTSATSTARGRGTGGSSGTASRGLLARSSRPSATSSWPRSRYRSSPSGATATRSSPSRPGIRLARSVQKGELLVLPAAGHFIPRGRADELLPVLERFLERHAPRD